jgi:hypothetical protein
MSRGALLFAFNTPTVDYFKTAVATARRINHFLNLPVSVVTNSATLLEFYNYKFDNIYEVTSDDSNTKEQKVWINKGRHQAYNISPYDETLLLDTDYLINSDKLLSLFDYYNDIYFHNTSKFLMYPNSEPEKLGPPSLETYWATVMIFKKSKRAEHLFDCMKMVQDNYQHYTLLHGSLSNQYRNDYALTVADRILNGHIDDKSEFIPWDLLHVTREVKILRNTDDEFNTSYTAMLRQDRDPLKPKKEYITLNDMDFHMLDKDNFVEVM